MPIFYRVLTSLCLCLGPSLAAAEPPAARVLDAPLDIHRTSDLTSPVVLSLPPGEKVWVMNSRNGVVRVRFHRGGSWRSGYAEADQLDEPEGWATNEKPRPARGPWQVGVTAAYSVLSQGARKFQTQDEVNWSVSSYASSTAWPAVFVQYGHGDFWRAALGIRRVDFRGHAVADVDPSNTRDIEVTQNMISGRLERAWRVFAPAYLSVGGEVARANSLTERIGGIQVPTTSADIKVYAGAAIGIGAAFEVAERVGGFVEARAGAYPTLSPMAYVFEGAAGVGYCF